MNGDYRTVSRGSEVMGDHTRPAQRGDLPVMPTVVIAPRPTAGLQQTVIDVSRRWVEILNQGVTLAATSPTWLQSSCCLAQTGHETQASRAYQLQVPAFQLAGPSAQSREEDGPQVPHFQGDLIDELIDLLNANINLAFGPGTHLPQLYTGRPTNAIEFNRWAERVKGVIAKMCCVPLPNSPGDFRRLPFFLSDEVAALHELDQKLAFSYLEWRISGQTGEDGMPLHDKTRDQATADVSDWQRQFREQAKKVIDLVAGWRKT